MPLPPLYLDECMDPAMIEPLRQRGFDVTSAQLAGHRGANDLEQLNVATRLDRLIVSENGKHFRAWHRFFQQQGLRHGGIAIVPQTEAALETLRVAMMLDWIVAEFPDDHRSRYFTWGHLQSRLEQGYRLPGFTEADVRRVLGRS
jgi:hypothetical protein